MLQRSTAIVNDASTRDKREPKVARVATKLTKLHVAGVTRDVDPPLQVTSIAPRKIAAAGYFSKTYSACVKGALPLA